METLNFTLLTEANNKMKMEAKLHKFGAMRCIVINDFNHISQLADFIEPFQLNFIMKSQGEEREMVANIEFIKMILSYRDIEFAISCWKATGPLLAAFTTPFPDNENKKPTNDNDVQLIDLPEENEQIYEEDDIQTGGFQIALEGISLSLLNDRYSANYSIPIGKVVFSQITSYVNLYNGSKPNPKTSVYSQITTIMIDAYNTELAAFEPVIEPWNLELQLDQSPTFMSLQIVANEVMNINFTKQFLDYIFESIDLYQKLMLQFNAAEDEKYISSKNERDNKKLIEELEMDRNDVSFYPYIIKNRTGKSIKFWLSGKKKDSTVTLARDKDYSLKIDSERGKLLRYNLSFQVSEKDGVEYDKVIKNVSIDTVGEKLFSVSTKQPKIKVVVDISYVAGSKIIIIRGDHVVNNETTYDLELSLLDNNGARSETFTLASKSVFSIPIDLEFDLIELRPNDHYTWSQYVKGENASSFYCTHTSKPKVWKCVSTFKIIEFPSKWSEVKLVLSPPYEIVNLLPVPIKFFILSKQSGKELRSKTLEPGTKQYNYFVISKEMADVAMSIELPEYNRSEPVLVHTKKKRETSIPFELRDSSDIKQTILSDIVTDVDTNLRKVILYSKYWISNCTGLQLNFSGEKGGLLPGQNQNKLVDLEGLHGDPRSWYMFPLVATEESDKGEDGRPRVGKPSHRLLYSEKGKIKIQVDGSDWSQPFPLGQRNEGKISFNDSVSGRQYNFAVSVSPAPGKFWRTCLARIYPGIILVNLTEYKIFYRQQGSIEGCLLERNEQLPFHWEKNEETNLLQVKLEDDTAMVETDWSIGFNIDSVDHFQLKLKHKKRNEKYSGLAVNIKSINGTNYVVMGGKQSTKPDDNEDLSFYKINNQSLEDVEVSQKGLKQILRVDAGTSLPFFWDMPQSKEKILVLSPVGADHSKELLLDQIQGYPPIRGAKTAIGVQVVAEGPTRVLLLSEASESEIRDDSTSEIEEEVKKIPQFKIKASLVGIGLCCIDAAPKSIMYLSLQTIDLGYETSNIDQTIEFSVKVLQIDNQIERTPFPVVLYFPPRKDKLDPNVIHFSMVRDTRYPSIDYIKQFAIIIQEFDLQVDQIFLVHMVKFSTKITEYLDKKRSVYSEPSLLKGTDERLTLLPLSELQSSNMVYCQILHINPIQINLSFITVHDDDPDAEPHILEDFLSYLGGLADLENAPIRLNALILENPFFSRDDLVSAITKHYTQSIIRQSYIILGSADFLGNPVSLVNNLGTGVYDFFYEPAKGFVTSPKEFGLGIVKGTKSLLQKSVFAVFNTTSKITGTVAKIGVAATFDEDFQRERARRQQQKARHVGEGVAYGMQDFAVGIYKGITGVVTEPIKGAQKEGAIGLVKGIGKGVTGVVFKPVVGAIDLVTRTTEGIKNTTTYTEDNLKVRVRPPRYFGADKILRIYNIKKAIGQEILVITSKGKFKKEIYLFHFPLPNNEYLMFTERMIINIVTPMVGTGWDFKWRVLLAEIKKIVFYDQPRISIFTAKHKYDVHIISQTLKKLRKKIQSLKSKEYCKFVIVDESQPTGVMLEEDISISSDEDEKLLNKRKNMDPTKTIGLEKELTSKKMEHEPLIPKEEDTTCAGCKDCHCNIV